MTVDPGADRKGDAARKIASRGSGSAGNEITWRQTASGAASTTMLVVTGRTAGCGSLIVSTPMTAGRTSAALHSAGGMIAPP